MTRRGGVLTAVTLTAFLCALSTGNRLYYFAALCFFLVLGWGFVSLPVIKRLIRVEASLSPRHVNRGESAALQIRVINRCPLPVKPLQLQVCMGESTTLYQVRLRPMKEGRT